MTIEKFKKKEKTAREETGWKLKENTIAHTC